MDDPRYRNNKHWAQRTLLIKLGSIAVHAEEMLSPGGHPFDRDAIKSLLTDPEVRAFLDDKEMAVYLPVKRC